MDGSPFDDEAVGSRWQVAVGNCEGVDLYGCFELWVFCVEMRWWVIVEVHLDHDAEEARSGIPCERRFAHASPSLRERDGRPRWSPLRFSDVAGMTWLLLELTPLDEVVEEVDVWQLVVRLDVCWLFRWDIYPVVL